MPSAPDPRSFLPLTAHAFQVLLALAELRLGLARRSAEEAARTERHPGIAFRGAEGSRRAWVPGTALDVWEIVAAYEEMARVPGKARWEKPQGKNPPLVMEKRFEVVGRGVALVIGCGTFPTCARSS